KLRRHAWGILNYFDFPISTAKVEGINNRIKVIKRRAYGYRDIDYFKLKIYNIHATRYPLL
ncbi:MAG: transposase, partial [Candidatus Aminicenantes bacterium]